MFHVRMPGSKQWVLIAAAAALGAGALTLSGRLARDPGERERAAPAVSSSYDSPARSATPPGAQSAALDQPQATGSIRAPAAQKPTAALVGPGPYSFSARREAGALVLRGGVPDAGARHELSSLARERFFQERIVDETRYADGAPPRFLAGARLALDQLSLLAAGEASISGTALRLEGEALYAQAAAEIQDKLRRGAPAGWTGSAEVRLRGADDAEAQ